MSLSVQKEPKGSRSKVAPIFVSFQSFLKKPRILDTVPPLSPFNFLLLLGAALVAVVPYGLVLELAGAGQFDHVIEEMLRDHKVLVMVAVIILAPLLEETAFRYHLSLKRGAFVWGLVLSLMLAAEIWWLAAILALYFISLFVMVSLKKDVPLHLVVYVSAILFGLVHMDNFREFDWVSNFYWVPFLVGIQFALGLLLGFIRLHYGMWKAIYFHAAYNAVLVIPAVVFGFE
ncbi:CPBP family intramembrane metalloprotease [Litoribacter ruber]|uniref:CPBP family glutamic-type intramembrane protease n=1 Tax=Litoribacter ruber TaxID=702568 RepID=UPI001BD915C6|nr:CPBP family glutamic-type intramembrane protease [Litoribacter ruber]MBT0812270.1 CPBP family intramembrane metalloprotease [Litoribacter ruber]